MTDLLPGQDTIDAPEAPVVEAPETPPVEATVLDSLRAARARIGAGAGPLDVPVPGYDGQLIIRFRWTSVKDLSRTSAQLLKMKDPTQQMVAGAADVLVATCDEVMVKAEDGKLVPLSTNGIPITFSDGERLAYALGFPKASSARETCIRVFNNEYALIDVASQVTTWLEDTSLAVDKEYVGE